MMISTKGRYALRVMIDLAESGLEEYVPLKEIADREEISRKYLENIMTVLSKAGLVDAIHGKGEIACTAEDALLHTRVISTVMELVPDAMTFPPERIRLDDGMYWVPGLGDTLKRCYETERILPL